MADLVAELQRAELPNSVGVDDAKLKVMFLRIHEAQRRAPISPPLIEITADEQALRIADRRFYLALKSMGPDEFEEWFEKRRPSEMPRPRRRANISAALPQQKLDRFLEQAKEAAFAALGGKPTAAVGAEPAAKRVSHRRGATRPRRVRHHTV